MLKLQTNWQVSLRYNKYCFWQKIQGYEDYYEICILGVKNRNTGKWRRAIKGKIGYLIYSLYKDGRGTTVYFHRLVGIHFIFNPSPKSNFINHKDGNKLNNCPANIEWVTQTQNNQHAYRTGLKNGDHKRLCRRGVHPSAKKVGKFNEQMILLQEFDCLLDAQDAANSSIWYFIKNKKLCPKGFYWRYL